MNFFRLSGKENDDGACLVWKCPKCEDIRDYHLLESRVQMSVAGLALGESTAMLDLRCVTCQFELRVPPGERALVGQAREITKAFRQGQMNPQKYIETIKALPARFIKDLLALTQEWKCAECGEENPVTFGTCWKCQAKHHEGEPELSEDAKPLSDFPHGGNPWEM
jgi:hypothetical protein